MEENFTRGTLKSLAPPEVFRRLALQGKDVWNIWRAGELREIEAGNLAAKLGLDALPPHDSPVDFSDINFTNIGSPEFSGMNFGDNANFGRTIFAKRVDFTDAVFGKSARFEGAQFGDENIFIGATFGKRAIFNGATFGGSAQFNETSFSDEALFNGATFHNGAWFQSATFGDKAAFECANFGFLTTFEGARFGFRPTFAGAILKEAALFGGADFGHEALFDGTIFTGGVRFDGARFRGISNFNGRSQEFYSEFLETTALKFNIEKRAIWLAERTRHIAPNVFQSISFAGCRFAGAADFSDRTFKAAANFRTADFATPPIFTNVRGAENIDPTGIGVRHIDLLDVWFVPWHLKYEWTGDSEIASRVRLLRRLMEESKAHDVERRLFIVERRLERGPLFRWNPAVASVQTLALFLFGILSNYGLSIVRPFAWLIVAFFSFHALTLRAFNATINDGLRGFWDSQLVELSLGNVLPILGTLGGNRRLLLADLFPTGVPSIISGLSVVHSLISVILIFLILLAIRNLFKIG